MLEKLDYFKFFNLKPAYEINKYELKNNYYAKLKNDKMAHKNIIEKYKFLNDDFKRYEYLLNSEKKYELSDNQLEKLIRIDRKDNIYINELIKKCKEEPFTAKKLEIWRYLQKILINRKNLKSKN